MWVYTECCRFIHASHIGLANKLVWLSSNKQEKKRELGSAYCRLNPSLDLVRQHLGSVGAITNPPYPIRIRMVSVPNGSELEIGKNYRYRDLGKSKVKEGKKRNMIRESW
jgi:hypothetical protein